MGRQRKSGGTFRVPDSFKKKNEVKSSKKYEEPDNDIEEDDDEMLNVYDGNRKDDDDDEEEVFIGDDEDEEDDSEDDDEDEDDENDVMNMVENLPAKLRQKVLMGKVNDNDDDSDDDDNDEDDEEEAYDKTQHWGKKKTYWSGDTADLEIGQDIEDAEDEELAAKDLEKQKLSRMNESDFFDDDLDRGLGCDNNNSSNNSVNNKKKQSKSKLVNATNDLLLSSSSGIKSNGNGGMSQLGSLSLGKSKSTSTVQVESLVRDASKLTSDQKLAMLTAESPELVGLVEDMNDKLQELNKKIAPLWKIITETAEKRASVDDDVVDYLEVKQQLLISYCMNITFYLYLKSRGISTRTHPVMKKLLELRYAMEKLRPIDAKLQHQIDRLIKLSKLEVNSKEMKTAVLRPNPAALLAKGGKYYDDDEDDEEEEEDNNEDDEEEISDEDEENEEEDNSNSKSSKNNKRSKKSKNKAGSSSTIKPRKYKVGDDYNVDDDDSDESEIEDDIDDDNNGQENDYGAKYKNQNKSVKNNSKKNKHNNEDGDDDDNDEENDSNVKEQQIYRAPKMITTHYREKEDDKRAEKLEAKKKRLMKSEIMDTLREEFGETPESSSSAGVASSAVERELREEADERRAFEEDRFVRLTLSRKDKKSIKRRTAESQQLNNLEEIGDIGEFDGLVNKMTATAQRNISGRNSNSGDSGGGNEEEYTGNNNNNDYDDDDDDDEDFGFSNSINSSNKGRNEKSSASNNSSTADSLRQAVSAFVQSSKSKNGKNGGSINGSNRSDDMIHLAEPTAARKQKYQSNNDDDDDDGEDDYNNNDDGGDEDMANISNGNNSDLRKRRRAPDGSMNDNNDNDSNDNENDNFGDNSILGDFIKRKKEFLKKKKEHYSADLKFAGVEDTVAHDGDKRGVTYEIMKNKGVTPYRKTENKNPRVKKRKAYEKAVVSRKGQVRDVITGAANAYGGETTGIKAKISRSRKFE